MADSNPPTSAVQVPVDNPDVPKGRKTFVPLGPLSTPYLAHLMGNTY